MNQRLLSRKQHPEALQKYRLRDKITKARHKYEQTHGIKVEQLSTTRTMKCKTTKDENHHLFLIRENTLIVLKMQVSTAMFHGVRSVKGMKQECRISETDKSKSILVRIHQSMKLGEQLILT